MLETNTGEVTRESMFAQVLELNQQLGGFLFELPERDVVVFRYHKKVPETRIDPEHEVIFGLHRTSGEFIAFVTPRLRNEGLGLTLAEMLSRSPREGKSIPMHIVLSHNDLQLWEEGFRKSKRLAEDLKAQKEKDDAVKNRTVFKLPQLP